ncbi:hypothetical protein TNCV_602571 [Trichonephila clavipes]|nr:hypothetical protein TNCV_602571 [Trichonephila clavipes]
MKRTISENTLPAGGGQWRKKPNENEIGVTLRGREWKSAGRGRKAQRRVPGAPRRSREKELLLFFYAARIKRMEPASRNLPAFTLIPILTSGKGI